MKSMPKKRMGKKMPMQTKDMMTSGMMSEVPEMMKPKPKAKKKSKKKQY